MSRFGVQLVALGDGPLEADDVAGGPGTTEVIWTVCTLPSLKENCKVPCLTPGCKGLRFTCTWTCRLCPCPIVPAAGLGVNQSCPSVVTCVEVKLTAQHVLPIHAALQVRRAGGWTGRKAAVPEGLSWEAGWMRARGLTERQLLLDKAFDPIVRRGVPLHQLATATPPLSPTVFLSNRSRLALPQPRAHHPFAQGLLADLQTMLLRQLLAGERRPEIVPLRLLQNSWLDSGP
jgi:hypothetical protein